MRRPAKVVYDSLDAAWRAAMLVFIERGWILTPYCCITTVLETTEIEVRPGFRWEFRESERPRRVLRCPKVRVYRRIAANYGCDRWHLTSTHRAMLPP